jgi:hypothetical protein
MEGQCSDTWHEMATDKGWNRGCPRQRGSLQDGRGDEG